MTYPAELFDLTDRVVLITGGSRGLGREMALAAARAGADVVIASRKYDSCVATAEEITAATGRVIRKGGAFLVYQFSAAARDFMTPHFARIDDVEAASWGEFGDAGAMDSAPFALPVTNFYMTDPISRASEVMAQCTREFINGEATGTDG